MVNRLLEAGANLEARDQEGRVPIQHLPPSDGRGEHEQEQRANDSNEIRNMDNLPHSLRTGPEEYERIQNALNPADSEGRTPLHRAAENESVLGVRKLLQAGADPNTADREGVTPLHLAVQSDSPETVHYLLEAGADPNAADKDGATPCTMRPVIAPRRGPALLDAGADPIPPIGRAEHPLTWPPHPIPPRP